MHRPSQPLTLDLFSSLHYVWSTLAAQDHCLEQDPSALESWTMASLNVTRSANFQGRLLVGAERIFGSPRASLSLLWLVRRSAAEHDLQTRTRYVALVSSRSSELIA